MPRDWHSAARYGSLPQESSTICPEIKRGSQPSPWGLLWSSNTQANSIQKFTMTSIKEDVSHISNGEEGDLKKLDTAHGDEAIKVLAVYEGDQTWTPEEENKLRRKIDLKLLPVLCVTYAFLYADKVLLGQAV